ncbi:50S ribosomal protein L4 [Candidatus Microgenomates bacterium]|nr:50S ribosomal protein L4 [Candidatus Microgenomates bacterium]
MKTNNPLRGKLYTQKAVQGKDVVLPGEFDLKENKSLMSQAVRVYEDRSHTGEALVKTRGEVVRTKKKWYKQKGTGGARHAARSAPIFVGGGVAHGPKGISKTLHLPKKMKSAALVQAISYIFSNEKAVLVTDLGNVSKTSQAAKMVGQLKNKLELKSTSKVLVVLGKDSYENSRFFKNIENVEVICFDVVSAYKLLFSGFVLMEEGVFTKKS